MHIKTIYWIPETEKFIFPLACNIWGGNMNKHFESHYWYVLNSSMSYLWVSNHIKGVTRSLDFWVQDPIVPQKPIHTKTFCKLFLVVNLHKGTLQSGTNLCETSLKILAVYNYFESSKLALKTISCMWQTTKTNFPCVKPLKTIFCVTKP